MTQLSRNPIHKDVFFEIRDDFILLLSQLRGQAETKLFFYDFFTKTERVMFAKRLAVALMIRKGFQYKDIQYILHVSSATISKMINWMDQGGDGLKKALDKLIREEHMEAFWRKINSFIKHNVTHPSIYS